MDSAYTATDLLAMARDGLRAIGYRHELLRENYPFPDILDEAAPTRRIELAAFAQEPLSYRSACFGIAVLRQHGPEALQPYRALGAPQILALHPISNEVLRWKIPAQGKPTLIERIDPDQLGTIFRAHKDEWSPESVLRAKSIGFARGPIQLDFFDAGLLPVLEEVVYKKLDRLLQDVIASSKAISMERHGREPDYAALFRMIFRFIAAKMLADRQFPGDHWSADDPQQVIAAIEAFYFHHAPGEAVLQDPVVQRVAWDKIRQAFLFQNLSVEALAYVYENTLVTSQVRLVLDTHATPPEIAEYIVHRLPIESLALDERRVFEPFAGHAPFLIAALGRLRSLLPPTWTAEERHAYFVRMLSGMEIDSFAREVARYSLILADYPNPDGWDIAAANAFIAPEFDAYLKQAQIVLCNPPYSDFSADERQTYTAIQSTNKAAEALRCVLRHPPQMLGFVLPRVFVDGQIYRETRRQLATTYREIETTILPDNVFKYSAVEPVLLIAHTTRDVPARRRAIFVAKDDYQSFMLTGAPTWQVDIPANAAEDAVDPIFWRTPLQRVWDALAHLQQLGEVIETHRGIEHKNFRGQMAELISHSSRPGFHAGIINVDDGFEPYTMFPSRYIDVNPEHFRGGNHFLMSVAKPKIIANAARLSRGPWTIAAVIDEQGLVATQQFHGIWPKTAVPLEILAALLNGPVANAFVSTRRTSRHNQARVIKQVPFPQFTTAQTQAIVTLVTRYRSLRALWRTQPEHAHEFEQACLDVMRQIDATVLAAYDLPPRLERELLDYFAGHPRPGPVRFDRYYPPNFLPAVPWRVFISEEFHASSARRTLERLPVINDPIISAMVADLDE
ncbi:MAG: N-6 DNA methylase [Roseiflexaceae bacterium]